MKPNKLTLATAALVAALLGSHEPHVQAEASKLAQSVCAPFVPLPEIKPVEVGVEGEKAKQPCLLIAGRDLYCLDAGKWSMRRVGEQP
jgi:hypothetical protein